MSGTKAGASKTKAKNLQKDPNYYATIGKIGGQTKTTKPKGFAADLNRARTAGAKGGRISKRTKATPTITNPDSSVEISTTVFFSKSAKVRAFLRTVTGRV